MPLDRSRQYNPVKSARRRQQTLRRCPGGCLFWADPRVPHLVHASEIRRDILQSDFRTQQPRLVAPYILQERVYPRQRLGSLSADILSMISRGDAAGERLSAKHDCAAAPWVSLDSVDVIDNGAPTLSDRRSVDRLVARSPSVRPSWNYDLTML
jgi:hypothetical protein